MTILPLFCTVTLSANDVEYTDDQSWFGQNEWPALGLPKPVRQLLEQHTRMLAND